LDVGGSALVTGASRGIGRAIAVELANRGFDTVAAMRSPEDGKALSEPTNGTLSVARMDVTDPSSFDIPRDLRVLVNNAGVDSEYLPVEHFKVDDWRSLFETNVLGTVSVTAAAIPALRVNRPAVVCNITSSSILASVPFYSAYRATKAAVSAFCDTLRVELAPFGIRVVEIMPGPIDTDMFRLSTGEQVASEFDLYRRMSEVVAELRVEHADPMVSSPADAASLIVDAILDDSGPMRYGCDPLSVGFLDLWRQSDDETMFSMTGKSLIDLVGSGGSGEVGTA
jgi:NAD(P)-dependent dehydrogenase (short-subunit alcohol dehydrogenase family)